MVLTTAGPVLFEPSGMMVGLDPHDGSPRWQEPHDHQAPVGVGYGPLATVVTQDDELTVVDARGGQTRFRRSVSAFGLAGGMPAGDARGVAVAGADELLYLDIDGPSWTRPVPDCGLDTTIDTDTITIVGQDGAIQRFDRDDGTSLGELPRFDGSERILGDLR